MIIIPVGDRSTEAEVSLAVIAYLRTCGLWRSDFDNLRLEMPELIELTKDNEIARSVPLNGNGSRSCATSAPTPASPATPSMTDCS